MAEAKEAFAKMLADAQLARKGGRPRTNPLPPGAVAKPAPVPVVVAKKPVVEKAPTVKVKAPPKATAAKKSPARRAPSTKAARPVRAKAPSKGKGVKRAARTTKSAVRGKTKKR